MLEETGETPEQAMQRVVRDVLGPLVRADGGELYLVSLEPDRIKLHLGGRFAGCPGNTLTTRRVIEPLIRAVAPAADVVVSAGTLLPAGAQKVDG
jgi:Fe-S cluster biogenesis protein NfuA